MPVMPPLAPVRRAASLRAFASALHTSATVAPSGKVTGGCGGRNESEDRHNEDRLNISRSRCIPCTSASRRHRAAVSKEQHGKRLTVKTNPFSDYIFGRGVGLQPIYPLQTLVFLSNLTKKKRTHQTF